MTDNATKIPETLLAAICAVEADLRRLEKRDENKFARYLFTSVDDFKDALRPMMAKYGLSIHMDQDVFTFIDLVDEKDKKKQVARFDFKIVLRHVSGEKDDPEIMTVCLPYTGAQTSGAARSYALKEWLKSKFLASSGDMQEEADMLEQEREGLRMSKQDARPMFGELEKGLREVAKQADYEAVAKWWADNRERLEMLPKDWFLNIRQEYASTYKDMKAQADLDRMSNDQLDELARRQEANSVERHPIMAG